MNRLVSYVDGGWGRTPTVARRDTKQYREHKKQEVWEVVRE